MTSMTPAQQHTHTSNRTRSHQARHPDDVLTPEQVDAIVLQAALDGCDAAQIRERLREARDAARESANGSVRTNDSD